jgi:serine/threonine protein phosphatase PrpC
MPPRPQAGDLVKVHGSAPPVRGKRDGCGASLSILMASMGDIWVIQVGDTRVHAPREDITIMSKA